MPEKEAPASILAQWDAVGAKLAGGQAPTPPARRTFTAAPPAAAEAEATEPPETPARGPGGKFLPRPAVAKPPAPRAATKALAQARTEAIEATEGDEHDAHAAEKAQLEALAKKLGFKIDGATVSVAERAQFREQRRKQNEEHQKRLEQVDRIASQKFADADLTAGEMKRAKAAWTARDYDGFAKELGAKDWNALIGDAVRDHADPNYRALQELRAKDQRRDAEQAAAKAQADRAEAQRVEAQQIREYQSALSKQAEASSDPIARAFADDPMFLNAVFNVQAENLVPGEDPISIEDAIRLPPRRGGSPLLEELRALYRRAAKAFAEGEAEESDQAATQPEPVKAGSTRAAPSLVKRPIAAISTKKATEAAAPGTTNTGSKEWMRQAAERMLAAAAEDRKSARRA